MWYSFGKDELDCPTDFDIYQRKDGKWAVMEYEIVGGPLMEEPKIFDTKELAMDWISAQRFAYNLLVKIKGYQF